MIPLTFLHRTISSPSIKRTDLLSAEIHLAFEMMQQNYLIYGCKINTIEYVTICCLPWKAT